MKLYQTPKSDEIGAAARQVIPGGVMSNFRKSEDYHAVYMSHGSGARLYDVDGNEYIDYSLSYGPAILGHSNEHLRHALEDQVKQLHTSEINALECQAAQKVSAHLASAELVRFACSGTEANYNALRAARAYTARNMIVRFNGHYHGGLDQLIGGIVTTPENPVPVHGQSEEDFYSQMTHTAGRARHAFNDCYMIEWNDLHAVESLFLKYGDDIAAVIMEPVMVNLSGCMPEHGYLEGVRDLCTRYGVVLIFDEVLTGFRIGLKGAQGYFGVTPDMTTLGKALGGGFPVSAFCGKQEIMDLITRTEVVAGGTYNGHPLAMAAVIATIEELEKDDGAAYKRIEEYGTMFKKSLEDMAQKYGQTLLLQGFPGAWTFTFTSKKKIVNHKDSLDTSLAKVAQYGSLLKERGVLTSLRFCTSAAHTEKDVGEALDRAEDAMKVLSVSEAT
ncbi:MAG: aspartate aminotransferase family protein [Deltaproteobacteria bacterium]|nr:aspartate aminotransferase family protein [Deltaproteobacteria bacterium]